MGEKNVKKRRSESYEANNNLQKESCSHLNDVSFSSDNARKKCSFPDCGHAPRWQCGDCNEMFCGNKQSDHANIHSKEMHHPVLLNLKNRRLWCNECECEVFPSESQMEATSSTRKPTRHEDNLKLVRAQGISCHLIRGLSSRGRHLEDCALDSRPVVLYPESDLDSVCPRGLTGLVNLGNTCYFNAAIQLLSNCSPFSQFFRHKSNLRPWSVKQPVVSNAIAQLMQKIWAENRQAVVSPSLLIMRIREEYSQFRGWTQQDAQELIRCFLELLHRELGQPVYAHEEYAMSSTSSSNSTNDDDGAGDSGMSSDSDLSGRTNEGNRRRIRPERPVRWRSIVSDVFDGQLESSVKCLTCNTVSTTTETFQDLSLPIPSREQLERIEALGSFGNEYRIPSAPSLWGSWVSWARWWSSFVLSPAVSLEDCLDAFFCPDKLTGDDMYSCEKCNKLRNGVKSCRVSRLPEILCIHLKRFRHDHFSSSKVWTRVDFPLHGLDMSRWTGDCRDSEYELTGVITHEGGGADSGHYIAYCKNEIDENWYEFDDSTVTKLDPSYVLTKEAYVLLYQRVVNDKIEEIREKAFDLLHPQRMVAKKDARFFISTEWLERLGTFSEPGPISNNYFLCRHGHILPRRTEAIPQLVTRISEELWNLLYEEFGGGPELTSLHYCLVCEKHYKWLNEKRRKEWEMFRHLEQTIGNAARVDTRLVYSGYMPPTLINKHWLQTWHKFIHDSCQDQPGAIDNNRLVETIPDGRTKLKRRANATSISRECFVLLQNIYGGGPEVFAIDGAQPSEHQVREWIVQSDESIQKVKEALLGEKAVRICSSL